MKKVYDELMNLSLLGLSKKELQVLHSLQNGASTPLLLSRETKVSRTAVYAILKNLKKRGLAYTRIAEGRKYWTLLTPKEFAQIIQKTKQEFLGSPSDSEEVHESNDSLVIIHRGKTAIRHSLSQLFTEISNERLFSIQGNIAENDWNEFFSVEETNQFNQNIKKNHMIIEALLPEGWFETHLKFYGTEWAKEFQGRMTRTVTIEPEYFNHGGQIFMSKGSIYLLALKENILIEIQHSQIQKMLLSIFMYMQDKGRLIDPNELLKRISIFQTSI